MIADAAVALDATVVHLMKPGTTAAHTLLLPALIAGDRVVDGPPGD